MVVSLAGKLLLKKKKAGAFTKTSLMNSSFGIWGLPG